MNTSKGIFAAALALSSMGNSPASANYTDSSPIKIGVLDAKTDRIISTDKNLSLFYKEFNQKGAIAAYPKSDTGWHHGVLVATAAVRQIREIDKDSPIEVYSANAFVEKPSSDGKSTISALNYESAKNAIAWFKENGVKVVVASFVGKDSQGMRSFALEAENSGILLVAPVANTVTKEFQFPAHYPSSISVGALNNGLPLMRDAEIAKSVDFSTDGSLPIRAQNNKNDYGSSFAAARIAGILSVIHNLNPIKSVNEAKEVLSSISTPRPHSVGSVRMMLKHIYTSSVEDKIKGLKASWQLNRTPPPSKSSEKKQQPLASAAYAFRFGNGI